ncbi:MAG TPA: MBL fold metallo-hydrolase [Saprospiraceae bacterium]|nr:MBL fold metallo-hydrolase [Saprospiraceae bacterium]
MKITFLGTGTSLGVPIIGCSCETCNSKDPRDKRLRTSCYVQTGDYHFLIDIGPDFRQQMLREKISKIDFVLITHEHNDHIAGIDDIRPFNFMQNQSINFYCNDRVYHDLISKYDYIFKENKYPGSPSINLKPILYDEVMYLEELNIVPILLMHGKIDILGYRIGKMAYLTDISSISSEELSKLQGIEVLIISALRKESHHSHINLSQAIDIYQSTSASRCYLIHLSHHYPCHEALQSELPVGVFAAYDGMSIGVTKM